MICSKCRRTFTPPAALSNLVKATTGANRVPVKALKLVCPECLKKPKEIAK